MVIAAESFTAWKQVKLFSHWLPQELGLGLGTTPQLMANLTCSARRLLLDWMFRNVLLLKELTS
jgi:hypothetical protein